MEEKLIAHDNSRLAEILKRKDGLESIIDPDDYSDGELVHDCHAL